MGKTGDKVRSFVCALVIEPEDEFAQLLIRYFQGKCLGTRTTYGEGNVPSSRVVLYSYCIAFEKRSAEWFYLGGYGRYSLGIERAVCMI